MTKKSPGHQARAFSIVEVKQWRGLHHALVDHGVGHLAETGDVGTQY